MTRFKCECGCTQMVVNGLAQSKYIRQATAVFVCSACQRVYTEDVLGHEVLRKIADYEFSDKGRCVLKNDEYSWVNAGDDPAVDDCDCYDHFATDEELDSLDDSDDEFDDDYYYYEDDEFDSVPVECVTCEQDNCDDCSVLFEEFSECDGCENDCSECSFYDSDVGCDDEDEYGECVLDGNAEDSEDV